MSAPRLLAALLALALFGMAGCGDDSERPAVESYDTGLRVLVVGIDGATFRVIDPLLAAGELPTLGAMIERGAAAPLVSQPPMRSPALWTTIATGVDRETHGIEGFTVPGPDGKGKALVNSTMRRRLNVWDMVGAAGRTVGVSGWWSTWPAEAVHGWMVSDRLTRSRWSEWSDGVKQEGLTYPAALAGELLPLVVDPMNPPLDEIRRIVDLDDKEVAELLAAERPVWAHALSVLKFAYCNQRSYEKIAMHLLSRAQPDLAMLFLIANDPVSHTFWHWHEPEAYDFGDRPLKPRWAPTVANMYRHNDRFMAQLLELVGDDTVVLVVSDHGFRPSGRLPKTRSLNALGRAFDENFLETEGVEGEVTVGQSGVHHRDGILIAAGGPIVGGRFERFSIRDVAPTLLALLGLPVAEDLDGRVLTEIIDPEFLERFPVQSVPSYEELIDRRALRTEGRDDAGEEEALEMLRSLGYIQ